MKLEKNTKYAVETITLTVDPAFVLNEGGYCDCDLCCKRFETAFNSAAETVAEDNDINIVIETGSYSSCNSDDDPNDLWLQVYNWIAWTDHEDLHSKNEVAVWDDVATYEATFPNGNEPDGYCDVTVYVGQDESGYWYGRTSDDAGGVDFAPVSPVGITKDEAISWAEEFSSEMDES